MSRLKVYYTIDEVELNLYTSGSEYMLMDSTEYKGLYHKYITTHEVYTLSAWNETDSKKLIPYRPVAPIKLEYLKLNPDIKTEYQTVEPYNLEISVTDRKNGFVTRYFIQKVNSLQIMEIDKQQFDDYNSKKIDPNVYRVTSLKWCIVGTLSDSFDGNIYTPSIQTKNKKSISTANKIMPGINKKITNLTEYYSDVEFLVPPDINPK